MGPVKLFVNEINILSVDQAFDMGAAAVGATMPLVPALGNVSRMGGGRWSFWKSLRHNGEIFIAIYVLICLGWIVRQTF